MLTVLPQHAPPKTQRFYPQQDGKTLGDKVLF